MIRREQEAQENALQEIPILYWLVLAVMVAGLYILALVNIEASRTRVQEFRFTSDSQTMNLAATEKRFKKPSPFGKPVRNYRAAAKQNSGQKPSSRTS